MTSKPENGDDLSSYKDTIRDIRSDHEEDRKHAIVKIPDFILQYFQTNSEILKQTLLVIHNLNSDSEVYERLTMSNRTAVIRFLLRLYSETMQNDYQHEQMSSLIKLVNYADTPELLIELANVLYNCTKTKLNKEDSSDIEGALDTIKEKATENLYPDALLVIHSILAMRQVVR